MITLLGPRIVPKTLPNDGYREIEVAGPFIAWTLIWGSLAAFLDEPFAYALAVLLALAAGFFMIASEANRYFAEALARWRAADLSEEEG